MGKSEALKMSLLASICTIFLAAVSANIMHSSSYPLTINMPVVFFFAYLVSDASGFPGGSTRAAAVMRAAYWELSLVLCTVLVMGMRLQGVL